MSVESFDPGSLQQGLDGGVVAALCALAPAGDDCELDREDITRFAYASKHNGWAEAAGGLDNGQIQRLIRLFTLGEERYPEWAGGAKSPVIALVRELKKRDVDSTELIRWIKTHTSNKFLPHGSLMDRL
jgi:hypothetical protein